MRIRIPALKEGLNPVEEVFEVLDIPEDMPFYKSEVVVKGEIDTSLPRIDLRVIVSATGSYVCDRCAADFQRRSELPLRLHLFGRDAKDEAEAQTDGLVFIGTQANEVDLTDEVLQVLMLDVPMKVLCKDDCQGLCYICGSDLNESPCDCNRVIIED